jgi:hypothetical protein
MRDVQHLLFAYMLSWYDWLHPLAGFGSFPFSWVCCRIVSG